MYGTPLPFSSTYTIYISSNMDACIHVFFISLLFALSAGMLYFSHALSPMVSSLRSISLMLSLLVMRMCKTSSSSYL